MSIVISRAMVGVVVIGEGGDEGDEGDEGGWWGWW